MLSEWIKTTIFALLIIGICSKYKQTTSHSFYVPLPQKSNLEAMYLSQDSDRLAVISRQTNTKLNHIIINFASGTQQCNGSVDINMIPLGFPTHTNLLYFDNSTSAIVKMNAPCAIPMKIANSYDSKTLIALGSTQKESYVVFGGGYRNLTEYNIQGWFLISKNYLLNAGQTAIFMSYSSDRDYLWVGAKFSFAYKIVSFDTSSGKKKSQIFMYQNTTFLRGNNHGDAFVGMYGNTVYNFDDNGNRKIIRNSFQILGSFDSQYEKYLGICTTDDVMLTVKFVAGPNPLTLFVYSTEDGSEIQNFGLDFIRLEFEPSKQVIACNDKYLAILDTDGKFHIFEYSHTLAWWVILLIAVGGVVMIGGSILGFVFYRTRKMQNQNGYQQFRNESKV